MNLETSEFTYIGSFAVDSGQAIVGDPCYLDKWESEYEDFEEHKNSEGRYGYLGACNATLTNGYGELGNGKAVAFTTGWGDGLYSVYSRLDDSGRIGQILIDFEGVFDSEEEE